MIGTISKVPGRSATYPRRDTGKDWFSDVHQVYLPQPHPRTTFLVKG